MSPDTISIAATVFFALAIFHTFSVKRFQHLAVQYPEGSTKENLFHLLGEVEIVFGFWAGIFILFFTLMLGFEPTVKYLEKLTFTEPWFVFAIMVMASSRPILLLTENVINFISRMLPFKRPVSFFLTVFIVGPLLGSFITEPAAMTVIAFILLKHFFAKDLSHKFKYAMLGLLFVNISIGGTLTPFAAPPVVMVAGKWGWGIIHMFMNFGWKAALAISISTSIIAFKFRDEISTVHIMMKKEHTERVIPAWLTFLHILFLVLLVATAHHDVVFIGLFLFYLGMVTITKEYQDEPKLREGLLVAFFLGGLVILGGMQRWWLEPLLNALEALPLYLGTTALTAFTDNAALTYLGSQVPSLSDISKYALVSGAVVGGGLTVIANAPNPAGYSILNSSFGSEGISPLRLFLGALTPTLIALAIFWLF